MSFLRRLKNPCSSRSIAPIATTTTTTATPATAAVESIMDLLSDESSSYDEEERKEEAEESKTQRTSISKSMLDGNKESIEEKETGDDDEDDEQTTTGSMTTTFASGFIQLSVDGENNTSAGMAYICGKSKETSSDIEEYHTESTSVSSASSSSSSSSSSSCSDNDKLDVLEKDRDIVNDSTTHENHDPQRSAEVPLPLPSRNDCNEYEGPDCSNHISSERSSCRVSKGKEVDDKIINQVSTDILFSFVTKQIEVPIQKVQQQEQEVCSKQDLLPDTLNESKSIKEKEESVRFYQIMTTQSLLDRDSEEEDEEENESSIPANHCIETPRLDDNARKENDNELCRDLSPASNFDILNLLQQQKRELQRKRRRHHKKHQKPHQRSSHESETFLFDHDRKQRQTKSPIISPLSTSSSLSSSSSTFSFSSPSLTPTPEAESSTTASLLAKIFHEPVEEEEERALCSTNCKESNDEETDRNKSAAIKGTHCNDKSGNEEESRDVSGRDEYCIGGEFAVASTTEKIIFTTGDLQQSKENEKGTINHNTNGNDNDRSVESSLKTSTSIEQTAPQPTATTDNDSMETTAMTSSIVPTESTIAVINPIDYTNGNDNDRSVDNLLKTSTLVDPPSPQPITTIDKTSMVTTTMKRSEIPSESTIAINKQIASLITFSNKDRSEEQLEVIFTSSTLPTPYPRLLPSSVDEIVQLKAVDNDGKRLVDNGSDQNSDEYDIGGSRKASLDDELNPTNLKVEEDCSSDLINPEGLSEYDDGRIDGNNRTNCGEDWVDDGRESLAQGFIHTVDCSDFSDQQNDKTSEKQFVSTHLSDQLELLESELELLESCMTSQCMLPPTGKRKVRLLLLPKQSEGQPLSGSSDSLSGSHEECGPTLQSDVQRGKKDEETASKNFIGSDDESHNDLVGSNSDSEQDDIHPDAWEDDKEKGVVNHNIFVIDDEDHFDVFESDSDNIGDDFTSNDILDENEDFFDNATEKYNGVHSVSLMIRGKFQDFDNQSAGATVGNLSMREIEDADDNDDSIQEVEELTEISKREEMNGIEDRNDALTKSQVEHNDYIEKGEDTSIENKENDLHSHDKSLPIQDMLHECPRDSSNQKDAVDSSRLNDLRDLKRSRHVVVGLDFSNLSPIIESKQKSAVGAESARSIISGSTKSLSSATAPGAVVQNIFRTLVKSKNKLIPGQIPRPRTSSLKYPSEAWERKVVQPRDYIENWVSVNGNKSRVLSWIKSNDANAQNLPAIAKTMAKLYFARDDNEEFSCQRGHLFNWAKRKISEERVVLDSTQCENSQPSSTENNFPFIRTKVSRISFILEMKAFHGASCWEDWIEIKRGDNISEGYGAYALRRFPKDSIIGVYVGRTLWKGVTTGGSHPPNRVLKKLGLPSVDEMAFAYDLKMKPIVISPADNFSDELMSPMFMGMHLARGAQPAKNSGHGDAGATMTSNAILEEDCLVWATRDIMVGEQILISNKAGRRNMDHNVMKKKIVGSGSRHIDLLQWLKKNIKKETVVAEF